MTPEEKFVVGCIAIPVGLVGLPLYLLALLFAWPLVLPLTGLLAWALWRWNKRAQARRLSQEEAVYLNAWAAQTERMRAALPETMAYFPMAQPPRSQPHGFLLPGAVGYAIGRAWEGPRLYQGESQEAYEPTSLDDNDEDMI